MKKFLKKLDILKTIADVIISLVFLFVAGILEDTFQLSEKYYGMLVLLLLFLLIFCFVLIRHFRLPYAKIYKNEYAAETDIRRSIRGAEHDISIRSKVGTSVFDFYDDYAFFLSKPNTELTVLFLNPDNEELVKSLDVSIAKKHDKWRTMVANIISDLVQEKCKEDLAEDYQLVIKLLTEALNVESYKPLLLAAKAMWDVVKKMAVNAENPSPTLKVHYLDFLPETKLWLFDMESGRGAAYRGNFNTSGLGRSNPIYLYKENKKSNQSEFGSAKGAWDIVLAETTGLEHV